jgi:hypothetical protein
LDGAEQQWALDKHKGTNDVPTMADIAPYFRGPIPSCSAGGVYALRKVCDGPTCSLKGHQLP